MFVIPKVFLIGYTALDMEGLRDYLEFTDQTDFLESIKKAKEEKISGGEALCSFYAKLCYKSLVLGMNANINKTRDISDNIKAAFSQGHGSVFEHCTVNFVATNVSRILTHELVRHRAGWAYSQTSGRYCRLENIDIVLDPILKGCEKYINVARNEIEHSIYYIECEKGLRKPPKNYPGAAMYDCELPTSDIVHQYGPDVNAADLQWVPNNDIDMTLKKQLTSAIRRIAPNGQSNEIGFTVNLRAIRHFIQMRSSRRAEWEIRCVAHQVYELLESKFPLLFFDAKKEMVNGFYEITGMTMQPYEVKHE